MPTKPEPYKYYDIYEILKYFKLKNIEDLIDINNIDGNGSLVTLDWDDSDEKYLNKFDRYKVKRFKNVGKVHKEFGEIEIKVWW